VIAATNQNLETLVARPKIPRGPLLPAWRVIPIQMPALRERRDDIGELTDYFVSKAVQEMGARATTISPERATSSESAIGRANVRELENAVMRAALLAPGTNHSRRRRRAVASRRRRCRIDRRERRRRARRYHLNSYRGMVRFTRPAKRPRDLYHRLVAEIERPLVELALKARRRQPGSRGAECSGSIATRCAKRSPTTRSLLTKFPGG